MTTLHIEGHDAHTTTELALFHIQEQAELTALRHIQRDYLDLEWCRRMDPEDMRDVIDELEQYVDNRIAELENR